MIQKTFLMLFLSMMIGLQAQNVYRVGIIAGTSDWLRKDDPNNHYNYTQNELGLSIGKDFGWKHNATQSWNKYWITQLKIGLSQYNWTISNEDETTFHTHFTTGIRVEKEISKNTNFESAILLSSGYHSGLTQRMSQGIYFREGIEIGINKTWQNGLTNLLSVGYQHASNANIYIENRGFETLYLKLGILWHQKK